MVEHNKGNWKEEHFSLPIHLVRVRGEPQSSHLVQNTGNGSVLRPYLKNSGLPYRGSSRMLMNWL